MLNVTYLGLGAIGRPMAARLAHAPDIRLTVWNRTAARAESFAAEHGAVHVADAAEAVAGADIVITCLPVSADVLELLEAGGVAGAMRPGTILMDCTSGDPATSRVMAELLAARGIGYLDAPVSGGVAGAERGQLTVMIGGEAAHVERVRPVLAPCAAKVVLCGATGSGAAVKAMNNALLAIHIWSTGEALVALSKAGIDPAVALDVINSSSGRSNASMNLFPERVLTRAFPRTFRLGLLDKDVRIAADLAEQLDVMTPMVQLASQLFDSARQLLGEEVDHVEAVKLVEQIGGQEIA